MNADTDAKRSAHPPAFQKGDKGRVRNLLHVLKGHKRFSDPLTIRVKVGNSTYILSNGKTWKSSHRTVFPDTATTDKDTVEP